MNVNSARFPLPPQIQIPPVQAYYDMQRRFAQAPPKVKLPDFWPKQAAAWFTYVEATCHAHGMLDSRQMFNATLIALPTSLIENLGHLLHTAANMADPFEQLRSEVTRRYTPCVQELLNAIVQAPDLGGRAPTELMRSMLVNLPVGEPAGLLFKHMFVLKLPADMQETVGRHLKDLNPMQLAEYADQRWHIKKASKQTMAAAVAAIELLNISDGENTVAAIGKQSNKGKQQKKKEPTKRRYLCLNHTRWMANTRNCADPDNCQWTENNKSGAQ